MNRSPGRQLSLFGSDQPVSLFLPDPVAALGNSSMPDEIDQFRALIAREIYEFETELGAPVNLATKPGSKEPRFLIGPANLNPAFSELGMLPADEPSVWVEPKNRLLVADGPGLDSVVESLSLLRTLTSSKAARVTASWSQSLEDCIERIEQEVAWTYPAFHLRGVNWDELASRHRVRVLDAANPFTAMQRWIAELGDMHTWVRPDPPDGLLPYTVRVDADQAVFVHVPAGTPAEDAGVQRGDQLLNVDPRAALERTGGPSHMKPYLAGRRLLSGPAGIAKTFTTQSQDGTKRTFGDAPTLSLFATPVEWFKRSNGTGYVRIHEFPPGINQRIDTALQELRDCSKLIIDVRGNTGGMLTEALDFRDRFIDRPMTMGTIQYSSPGGGLSPAFPIDAEPTSKFVRWPKPVRFLTDQMTASASEDALLGLQGLPNIQLVGAPTAGGSGRPRSIRLLPGMRLSVSTALTFDRAGHCVEENGLRPDIEAPTMLAGDDHEAIEIADRSW
jgi:carboxyl-terminal processing protease